MTRRRFSARNLAARLIAYDGQCAECRCKVGGAAGLEWDHVIPLELGGEDEISNLQPLCRGCHRAKTASDVRAIRKAERQRQREAGIRRQPKAIIPGSSRSPWRRRLDGTVVRRDAE